MRVAAVRCSAPGQRPCLRRRRSSACVAASGRGGGCTVAVREVVVVGPVRSRSDLGSAGGGWRGRWRKARLLWCASWRPPAASSPARCRGGLGWSFGRSAADLVACPASWGGVAALPPCSGLFCGAAAAVGCWIWPVSAVFGSSASSRRRGLWWLLLGHGAMASWEVCGSAEVLCVGVWVWVLLRAKACRALAGRWRRCLWASFHLLGGAAVESTLHAPLDPVLRAKA